MISFLLLAPFTLLDQIGRDAGAHLFVDQLDHRESSSQCFLRPLVFLHLLFQPLFLCLLLLLGYLCGREAFWFIGSKRFRRGVRRRGSEAVIYLLRLVFRDDASFDLAILGFRNGGRVE